MAGIFLNFYVTTGQKKRAIACACAFKIYLSINVHILSNVQSVHCEYVEYTAADALPSNVLKPFSDT